MPTERFYLANVWTPAVTSGAGAWNDIGYVVPRGLGSKSGSVSNVLFTDAVVTSPWRILAVIAYSHEVVERRAYTGPVSWTIGVLAGSAAMNAYTRIHLWIQRPDGGIRGVLASELLGEDLWTTGATARSRSGAPVDQQVIAEPGDRIVAELGALCTNTVDTAYNARMYFGGTSTTDLAPGDTGTAISSRPGWIDIDWSPPSANVALNKQFHTLA